MYLELTPKILNLAKQLKIEIQKQNENTDPVELIIDINNLTQLDLTIHTPHIYHNQYFSITPNNKIQISFESYNMIPPNNP